MPPHGAMWGYHPPKHHNLPHDTLANGSRDFTRWCVTELLCDLEKGTMRAAVDGVEIARYTHPHPGGATTPRRGSSRGPSACSATARARPNTRTSMSRSIRSRTDCSPCDEPHDEAHRPPGRPRDRPRREKRSLSGSNRLLLRNC